MRPRADKWARGVGLLLGLFLTASAVWAWHLPRGNGTLGAQLIVSALPTGELEVTPAGQFLSAPSMRPTPISQAQSGQIKIRNITPKTLAVHMTGVPSSADLNSLLWVQVNDNGSRVFRGTLGTLQQGIPRPLVLRPQQAATLDFRAWLPPGTGSGYEGRIQTVNLEFRSSVQGAAT